MTIDITKFFIAIVVIDITLVIIIYIFGTYFDIKIQEEKYSEHGKSIALLNAIGESSNLIMKDSNGQPKKLIFEKDKLDRIEKDKELSCCYYYDYDYLLTIKDFRENNEWNIGFDDLDYFLRKGKKCNVINNEKYLLAPMIPVVIFNGTDYNPGSAILTESKTPLSNIAYTIALVCSTNTKEKTTYVYSIDSIEITDYGEKKNICIKYGSKKRCKEIDCNMPITKNITKNEEDKEGCYKISVKKYDNKIEINYPIELLVDLYEK